MAHRTLDADHATLAKWTVLIGVGLFAAGGVGELVLTATGTSGPTWLDALLFDAEVLGVVVAMFGVFVVGILLPLLD